MTFKMKSEQKGDRREQVERTAGWGKDLRQPKRKIKRSVGYSIQRTQNYIHRQDTNK